MTLAAGGTPHITQSISLGTVSLLGTTSGILGSQLKLLGHGISIPLTSTLLAALNKLLSPSGISLTMLPAKYTYTDGSSSLGTQSAGKTIQALDTGALQLTMKENVPTQGDVKLAVTVGRVVVSAMNTPGFALARCPDRRRARWRIGWTRWRRGSCRAPQPTVPVPSIGDVVEPTTPAVAPSSAGHVDHDITTDRHAQLCQGAVGRGHLSAARPRCRGGDLWVGIDTRARRAGHSGCDSVGSSSSVGSECVVQGAELREHTCQHTSARASRHSGVPGRRRGGRRRRNAVADLAGGGGTPAATGRLRQSSPGSPRCCASSTFGAADRTAARLQPGHLGGDGGRAAAQLGQGDLGSRDADPQRVHLAVGGRRQAVAGSDCAEPIADLDQPSAEPGHRGHGDGDPRGGRGTTQRRSLPSARRSTDWEGTLAFFEGSSTGASSTAPTHRHHRRPCAGP